MRGIVPPESAVVPRAFGLVNTVMEERLSSTAEKCKLLEAAMEPELAVVVIINTMTERFQVKAVLWSLTVARSLP